MMIATGSRRTIIIVILIILSMIFSHSTAAGDLEYKDVSDFIQLWTNGMGYISSGEYSPDGSEFAIGNYYGIVFVYSSSDYKLQRKFNLRNNSVTSLDWSFDGMMIAVGSAEDIFILNSSTGGKIQRLDINGRIEYLKWSPSDYLIAVKLYNRLLIIDSISGDILHDIPDIRHMTWHPDGDQIACTTDSEIRIISSTSGDIINTMEIDPPEGNIRDFGYENIRWSPDGSKIAFISSWVDSDLHHTRSQLNILEIPSEDVLGSTTDERASDWIISWSPDSNSLIAGYWRRQIALYDINADVIMRSQEGHSNMLSISWSNLDDQILVISFPNTIEILDADSLDSFMPVIYDREDIEGISWSPDGMKIAICDYGYDYDMEQVAGRILILDSKNGSILNEFYETSLPNMYYRSSINSMDWAPKNNLIAYSISNQTIIIDAENGQILSTFHYPEEINVIEVLWSPSGEMIATRTNNYTTWIWNVESEEHILTLKQPRHINSISWSPDETQIATASYGTIIIWDTKTGDSLRTINVDNPREPFDIIYRIDWSPDGTLMACSYSPCMFGIINMSSGELFISFDQEELSQTRSYTTATVLKWSPDGTKLAARSDTIIIWDLVTEELTFLDSPSNYANDIETFDWSPDASNIVSGHLDGLVIMWGSPADVKISPSDITFSKSNPVMEEKISVSFKIWNNGSLDAHNISVRIYNNMTLIDEQIIDFLERNGGTEEIQLNFAPHRKENLIRIVLDEEDLIPEYNKTNNYASRMLIAKEPVDYGPILLIIFGIIGSMLVAIGLIRLAHKDKKKEE